MHFGEKKILGSILLTMTLASCETAGDVVFASYQILADPEALGRIKDASEGKAYVPSTTNNSYNSTPRNTSFNSNRYNNQPNAMRCLSVSGDTYRNTCNEPINVAYCYDKPVRGNKACGEKAYTSRNNYFTHERSIIKPNETGRVSHANLSSFDIAACFSGGTFFVSDRSGNWNCARH